MQQTVSTCAFNTLSGTTGASFVIALSGYRRDSSPGRTWARVGDEAGRFTAEVPANSTTPGNIDTGETDANAPQQVIAPDTTVSGTFQTTTQSARCTMSLSQQLANMTFSVYPVLGLRAVRAQPKHISLETMTMPPPPRSLTSRLES